MECVLADSRRRPHWEKVAGHAAAGPALLGQSEPLAAVAVRGPACLCLVELGGKVDLVVAGLEVGARHNQALVQRVALQPLALLCLQRLVLILLLLRRLREIAAVTARGWRRLRRGLANSQPPSSGGSGGGGGGHTPNAAAHLLLPLLGLVLKVLLVPGPAEGVHHALGLLLLARRHAAERQGRVGGKGALQRRRGRLQSVVGRSKTAGWRCGRQMERACCALPAGPQQEAHSSSKPPLRTRTHRAASHLRLCRRPGGASLTLAADCQSPAPQQRQGRATQP